MQPNICDYSLNHKKTVPDDAFCTVVAMLLPCVVVVTSVVAFVVVLAADVDVDVAVSWVIFAVVAFDVLIAVVSSCFVVAEFVVVVVVAFDVVLVSAAVELCGDVVASSCGCAIINEKK